MTVIKKPSKAPSRAPSNEPSKKAVAGELAALLFGEDHGVDDVGLLTAAGKVLTGDVHQRNIAKVRELIKKL